jgi:hypothetical protein
MRKFIFKSVTHHVARKLADVVYQKNANGELEAVFRPRLRTATTLTASQQAAHDRLRDASRYAKRALLDDNLRPIYLAAAKENDRRPRAVAAGDWFNPPVVRRFLLEQYRGNAGDIIEVDATDDVAVASVEVIVRLASGDVEIERGMATLIEGRWLYTATAPLAPGEAVTIEAIAKDHPGNEGRLTVPFQR